MAEIIATISLIDCCRFFTYWLAIDCLIRGDGKEPEHNKVVEDK